MNRILARTSIKTYEEGLTVHDTAMLLGANASYLDMSVVHLHV